MSTGSPLILGWREWVTLPELGVRHIKAKLDTGARSSALHAFRVEPFQVGARERVRFWLHPLQRDTATEVMCEADIADRRWVTDSGGHREQRYVIETTLRLGEAESRVEVTLTDRDTMRFRMLIGRTALGSRALVDSGRSYALGRPPKHPQKRRGAV